MDKLALLFQYYSTRMAYNAAADVCANENATLAIILSQAEAYFLSNMVHKIDPQYDPMIGLWCTGSKTASCRWIDGTPLLYSNFIEENDGEIFIKNFV